MPWNGKYMPDAMLTAALAAAAAAANGFKNAAFSGSVKAQLGTNLRALLIQTELGVDTTRYTATFTGDMPIVGGVIEVPSSWTQTLLQAATIGTGEWLFRIESAADPSNRYVQAPLTPQAGAGPMRLSANLVNGNTLQWSSVKIAPPALDTVAPSSGLVPTGQNLVWSSAQGQRLIGRGIFYWDDLHNMNCERNGTTHTCVSTRFRALNSGAADRCQIWFQDGLGYSRGNGGTARFRVFPDNGSGQPNMSGSPLASATYVIQNMSAKPDGSGVFAPRDGANLFPIHTMSSSTPLVAGNLYHLVVDNVAADPQNNSFCQDNAMVWSSSHGMAINRWLSTNEWAALQGTAPAGTQSWAWNDVTVGQVPGSVGKALPFMMIRIGGVWQGLMSVSSANPGNAVDSPKPNANQWVRAANAPIRERFTPAENINVVGCSFIANVRTAGSVLIEMKQGNTVLTGGTVTQATANETTFPDPYSGTILHKPFWYDLVFPTPVLMTAGTTYDLTFTVQGSSLWRFWDMRNGRDWGVPEQQAVCPSYAQHWRTAAGTWYGTNGYFEDDNNGVNGNWFVVLHRA